MAVKKYWDAFYKIGPPEVLYHYDPLADELAIEAARLLNCKADEITYTKNTTEAVVIASESLPLRPGDEILVLGEEYPANLLPWLKKQKDGITVRIIPHLHGPDAVSMLLNTVSERTKVIAMSSAQYYDGYMADLDAISHIAHARGAYFFVDAVQTIGIRTMDLSKIHIDMLACGGQKFLQAGPGIGFLYVNKKIIEELKDYKPGIRSITGYTLHGYTLKDSAARFQDGTQNISGIVALHASLKEINRRGIGAIEAAHYTKLHAVKATLQKYNIPFIDHGDAQSNIVSIPSPDANSLASKLRNQGLYVKPIKDVVRLSFIATTSQRDIEAAAKLITKALSS